MTLITILAEICISQSPENRDLYTMASPIEKPKHLTLQSNAQTNIKESLEMMKRRDNKIFSKHNFRSKIA